mgnify:FL=1
MSEQSGNAVRQSRHPLATARPGQDHQAVDPLIRAMCATHTHDVALFGRHLDDALRALHPNHAAIATIERARGAAGNGQWFLAHNCCGQALTLLVWTLPPDAATLPPAPDPDRASTNPAACPSCQTPLQPYFRHCPACGQQLIDAV